MTSLPPELEGFAQFLDAQPSNVRDIFHYCLCLMMVEAGKMEMVETFGGEDGAIYVFQSSTGEEFSVVRPDIGEEGEG